MVVNVLNSQKAGLESSIEKDHVPVELSVAYVQVDLHNSNIFSDASNPQPLEAAHTQKLYHRVSSFLRGQSAVHGYT